MSADSDPLDVALLTRASFWNVPVQVLEETTSSNDVVLRLGEAGASHGTLLFAERQTAGRGQFQRPWFSGKPQGLWFSLLLRMEISDATIPLLSSFAAVALAETLHESGFPEARIKAPNDLYLSGRKIAGILVETRPGKNPFAVVGIGLNVNQEAEDFPPELQHHATSLRMASKKFWNRNEVAAVLLKRLGVSEQLMRQNPTALLSQWRALEVVPKVPARRVAGDSGTEARRWGGSV
jgi:BirA family biotin operon repressor/biotin-[acetyl-CoA-carboxylase] ligase